MKSKGRPLILVLARPLPDGLPQDTADKVLPREVRASEVKALRFPGNRYANPWPEEIEPLGRRHVVRFSPCSNCPAWTWAAFGLWPLCLRCANLGRSVHGDACDCPTCQAVHDFDHHESARDIEHHHELTQ